MPDDVIDATPAPAADTLLFDLRDAAATGQAVHDALDSVILNPALPSAERDRVVAARGAFRRLHGLLGVLDKRLTDGGSLPADWKGEELVGDDEWWPDTAEEASPLSHLHLYQGQRLLHAHPGGDVPHGYYGHPEDRTVRIPGITGAEAAEGARRLVSAVAGVAAPGPRNPLLQPDPTSGEADQAARPEAYGLPRPPQPGDRNGQRVVLTSGANRLEGVVSSDSVTWLTLLTDTGARLALDLDVWNVETHGEPGEPAEPIGVRRGGYFPEGGIGQECSPACSEGHTYAGACFLTPADPVGEQRDGAADYGPVNGELVVSSEPRTPWRRITVRADEYGSVTLDVER